MMRINGSRAPRTAWRVKVLIAIAIALVAGCASATTRTAYAPEPAPCVDSVYAQLKAQPPDSLSEREWQRLQALDRECAAARTEAAQRQDVRAGDGHHRTWWMASGLIMAAMMVAMWSR